MTALYIKLIDFLWSLLERYQVFYQGKVLGRTLGEKEVLEENLKESQRIESKGIKVKAVIKETSKEELVKSTILNDD